MGRGANSTSVERVTLRLEAEDKASKTVKAVKAELTGINNLVGSLNARLSGLVAPVVLKKSISELKRELGALESRKVGSVIGASPQALAKDRKSTRLNSSH